MICLYALASRVAGLNDGPEEPRVLGREVMRLYDPTPIDCDWLFANCDGFEPQRRAQGVAHAWFGRHWTDDKANVRGCDVWFVPPGHPRWDSECRVMVYGRQSCGMGSGAYFDPAPCPRGWLLRLLELWGVPIKQVEG